MGGDSCESKGGDVYVLQVDALVDAERVCMQEGYAYCKLYEEEIEQGVYNREHRVPCW